MRTTHKWTKEQKEVVLETLYRKYNTIDESVIFELASQNIGTKVGSIKGIYLSFKKISKGTLPSKTKGGCGSFYNQETFDVYNEFVERNNVSKKVLDIMFSNQF